MIVAALLMGRLAFGGMAAAAPQPSVSLATLAIPGGAAALAEAAGLDPSLPRGRVMLALIRALYEVPEGVDAAADARRGRLRAYLNQLTSLGVDASRPPPDLVPLPLSASAWDLLTGVGRDVPLVCRILGDRGAALLYYGLAALDPGTVGWLDAQPDLLRALQTDGRPALIAAFGRSVRVKDGRIQVPGGETAEPLWTALVGEGPDRPGAFILRLLDSDGGRLALFYDSVAHLGPGQQAFAFGSGSPVRDSRRERFRVLYRAADRALAGFDPVARPFDRVANDLAHLLLMTPIRPEGNADSDESLELWRAALTRSGIPDDPRDELAERDLRIPLDAAALVSFVSTPDAFIRRERSETWFFGRRVFSEARQQDYPDVLVALRGFGRYTTLVLTLERLGIRRPSVFAQAIRHAREIEGIREARRARLELAQFQAVLGILDRARFSRTLGVATIETLVADLCATDVRSSDPGHMAVWVERAWLPALDRHVRPGVEGRSDRPIEQQMLAAMSGLSEGRPPGIDFEWEGLSYRVDPAAGEFRRLLAIRAKQGGASLDAALALARAATSMAGATSAAALDAARQRLTEAAALFAAASISGAGTAGTDARSVGALVLTAVGELGRLTSPRPADLTRLARPIVREAAASVAAVLLSLAYAPHLGYADSPVLLGGDPSTHHDFGLEHPRPAARARLAWRVPVEVRSRDAGWRLTGSALGLDVALARLSLRRAISETFPAPPAYRETERAALAEMAVLTNPFEADGSARTRLVAAVRAGRARLAATGHDPERLAALAAAAGLDEWRANLLPWMGANEPARAAEIVSLGELAALGGATDLAPGTLAASGWSLHAELGGVPLRWNAWTTLAGRKSTCLVPALVPDLAVGLAEAMEGLNVPPALGRGVQLMATQDLLDSLRTNHDDDWMTLIKEAQWVAAGPIEDYVAGQTIWGALIPGGESRP